MKQLMGLSLGELFAHIQRLGDRIRIYRQQITAMQRRIESLKNLTARQAADLRAYRGLKSESQLFHDLEREHERRLKAEAELDAMNAIFNPDFDVVRVVLADEEFVVEAVEEFKRLTS